MGGISDSIVGLGGCARQIIGCICCFIIIGPIFIICGLVMMKSGWDDPRSDKVDIYNAQAKTWDMGARDAFATQYGSNVTLGYQQSFMSGANNSSTIVLSAGTNVFPMADAGKDVYKYSRNQYYQGAIPVNLNNSFVGQTVSVFLPSPTPVPVLLPKLVRCKSKVHKHSDCSNKKHVIDNDDDDDRRLRRRRTFSRKAPVLHSKKCTTTYTYTHTFEQLERVDLSVNPADANSLRLVSDQAMCVTQPGNQNYKVLLTKTSLVRDCDAGDANVPLGASLIGVRLLSQDDPYISYQKVTGCWMWFGFTASTRVTAGIGFLVTGCLITAITVGVIFALFRRSPNSKVPSTPSGPTNFGNPTYGVGQPPFPGGYPLPPGSQYPQPPQKGFPPAGHLQSMPQMGGGPPQYPPPPGGGPPQYPPPPGGGPPQYPPPPGGGPPPPPGYPNAPQMQMVVSNDKALDL